MAIGEWVAPQGEQMARNYRAQAMYGGNPGSLIGRDSVIYPGTVWRGVVPARTVVKTVQQHELLARRD